MGSDHDRDIEMIEVEKDFHTTMPATIEEAGISPFTFTGQVSSSSQPATALGFVVVSLARV